MVCCRERKRVEAEEGVIEYVSVVIERKECGGQSVIKDTEETEGMVIDCLSSTMSLS